MSKVPFCLAVSRTVESAPCAYMKPEHRTPYMAKFAYLVCSESLSLILTAARLTPCLSDNIVCNTGDTSTDSLPEARSFRSDFRVRERNGEESQT